MMKTAILLATTALAAFPVAAQQPAQPAPTAEPARPEEAEEAEDHLHREVDQEIVVTAPFVPNLDNLAGTETLAGAGRGRQNTATAAANQ